MPRTRWVSPRRKWFSPRINWADNRAPPSLNSVSQQGVRAEANLKSANLARRAVKTDRCGNWDPAQAGHQVIPHSTRALVSVLSDTYLYLMHTMTYPRMYLMHTMTYPGISTCRSCVSEITHRHTFTSFTQALHTPRRVFLYASEFHIGRFKRAACLHGELEAHGAGAARDMVVASARTTAAEIAARDGEQGRSWGRTARGHTGWSHGWSARVRAYQALARRGRRWGRARPWSR